MAEDLPQASFAGQQKTYLNVLVHQALLDAIRRRWISLRTDRAIVYRASHGIDYGAVRRAVVMQRMVNAEVSSALFMRTSIGGDPRLEPWGGSQSRSALQNPLIDFTS